MGLLECASTMSIFRGYDYYNGKTVHNLVQITQDQYSAQVTGTAPLPYEVIIDISHPRKSKCSCPHANGRRIVCKHMLAVYFTVYPDEAQRIYEKLIADEVDDAYDEWVDYDCEENEEDDKYYDKSYKAVEYIRKMEKSELQQALLQLLFDGSERQYKRFIEEHCIDN